MALTLSEDLIRNRVGLQHDNLEDVKSLALPGTYHEKVVSLGTSLRKFSRLKHLDLSRNNISSLQGLEHLKLLEKLNLYYNNIETLEELKRLKYNPNLKELDLRLNPVTRTETDYRLYLIHMLPNLQKLDDRGVRDRERQGALIHYSSSQATEMTHFPHQEEPQSRPPNPRAEHVKTVGSGRVLDDDDVEILDLIARTGGDLSKARPLTGSNVKEASVEDYSIVGLKKLSRQPEDLPETRPHPKKNKAPSEIDEVMAVYKKKYPNIPDVLLSQAPDEAHQLLTKDPNLEFDDEADAYSKFKSHGYFTPNPATGEEGEETGTSFVMAERDSYPPPPARVQLERTRGADPDEDLDNGPGHRRSYSVPVDRLQNEGYDQPRAEKYSDNEQPVGRRTAEELPASTKNTSSRSENPESRLFLFQILDLVDRYWNGSKSLHKNNKFKGLAYRAVDDYLRTETGDSQKIEVQQLKDELAEIRKENKRLRRNEDLTKSSLEDNLATEAHLKASLQKAFTDVEMLKDKIQSYAAENKRLQQKIQNQDSYNSTQNVNQTQIDDIHTENDKLRRELEKQQIQLKQFKQLHELSSMLQESHKSLVQTNDHLLKELDESRQRHQHEVEQLNWSYNQLKKSMLGTSTHTYKGDNNASAILYDSDN
ncbi:centrosomal protein of 72 kDa-like [Mercenaria mercenaria]|uniref:centrosomal protein of 72 kDa-like n=1 Tax=Mercenaria mercenaria TaxID=6596 RepID=UPI00234F9349|nr:centrosomal protein of 72 kDa-like [Mercenaria mercenaria]